MADIRGIDPSGNPRDVAVDRRGDIFTTGRVAELVQRIEGIGTGSAYASGDAFGSLLRFNVPAIGTISNVFFHDYDDEGIAKELVLFRSSFTATADNSAFAVSDVDLRKCVGLVNIAVFYNFGSNQLGVATPALTYVAPEGVLYAQMVTRGADNIAAGSVPDITLLVV